MTPDTLFTTFLALLENAPGRPAGLTIKPHPLVELQVSELPFLGLSLESGDRPGEDEAMEPSTQRTTSLNVEIWASGEDPLAATKPIRDWVLGVVMADDTLGGAADYGLYRGFQADGSVLDGWVGVAVLFFDFTYRRRPA